MTPEMRHSVATLQRLQGVQCNDCQEYFWMHKDRYRCDECAGLYAERAIKARKAPQHVGPWGILADAFKSFTATAKHSQ